MNHPSIKKVTWIPDDIDIDAFVEAVDPDYTDHFMTVDAAFRHYWKYLDDDEKREVIKELKL